MELHKDGLVFAKLCKKYREQKADGKDFTATIREIKNLVSFSAERLERAFNLKLFKRTSGFDTGKGIPIIPLSLTTLINKQNFRKEDLTTLNVAKNKKIHGINIMMDYSGSMWFEDRDQTVSGLQRIYAQNFLALILGVYIQRTTRGQIAIGYNAYCQTSVMEIFTDLINADWDLLLVHPFWASHRDDYGKTTERFHYNYKPDKLAFTEESWFCNEYVKEALQTSIETMKGKRYNNFINVFMTDGGCHRLGESREDRASFLKKTLNQLSQLTLNFGFIIGEQQRDFKELLKDANIKYSMVNDNTEYNRAFEYLFHLINTVRC
jgi:hypothetical protein